MDNWKSLENVSDYEVLLEGMFTFIHLFTTRAELLN